MVCGAETFLGVGAVLVGIGLPLGLSFPYIFSSVLQLQLQLGPNSATFKEWNDSPIPIYMDIFLWNWTNAVEFAANSSIRPAFNEVGPFVFEVKTERSNVSWNDNQTVSFAPDRTYLYQPDMSLSLDIPITTLSPVAAVLAYYTRFWQPGFFVAIVNKEVELREQIYQTDKAGNWLFYGINDTFLDLIVPLKDIAELPLPFDKFAWFYGRNSSDTAEGTFTLFTGADDLNKLGKINRWKGSETSDAYDDACGHVDGFTGEVLPPMDEKPETLPVFSADVCSKIALEFSEDVEEYGVIGWQFIGSPSSLDNGQLQAENSCFCRGECVPTGLRNISECKFGAPAFISYPHFYLANDTISEKVDGMQPNQSDHEFLLKFEPTTGIPLGVRAQLQINLRIQPSETIKLFEDVPEVYIPMLWFRERADITSDLADMLKLILMLPTIGLAVFYSVAAIGLIVVIASIVIIFKRSKVDKAHYSE